MANLKKSSSRRQDRSWRVLPEGATVLVDTAPWIYLLQDHADFAPRFEGLFAAAEEGRVEQNRFVVPRADIELEFHQAGFRILGHKDFLPGYAMWRTYILRKKEY